MADAGVGYWRGARLLAVLAHPDDETFFVGGTLALYARRGARVSLVCATRGEMGDTPSKLEGFASVAAMREHELRRASSILGLDAVYFLDYRDSGRPGSGEDLLPQALAAAPADEVARQIAACIRTLRPHVVITFDPLGGYRHADHIAAQRATAAAFSMAADRTQHIGDLPSYSPQKLYYVTFPRRLLRWVVLLMRCLRQNPRRCGPHRNIDLISLLRAEFPIHACISVHEVIGLKVKASACYASQRDGLAYHVQWLQRWFDQRETFIRAFPADPPHGLEQDLFEGVDLDPLA